MTEFSETTKNALGFPPHYVRHEPTGWMVDPETGHVYGTHGTAAGERLGGTDHRGHLRASRKINGVLRRWWLRQVVWEAVTGQPLPDGHSVKILNGDKSDLRPQNLKCVPTAVVKNTSGRLSDGQVRAIREAHGTVGMNELARRYGVSPRHVQKIWQGVKHRHVT